MPEILFLKEPTSRGLGHRPLTVVVLAGRAAIERTGLRISRRYSVTGITWPGNVIEAKAAGICLLCSLPLSIAC
jgi:hypothetical protein